MCLTANGNCSYRIINKKNFKEGIMEKFFHERRVYESVDNESLSKAISQNLKR